MAAPWTGVAVAYRPEAGDGMASRLPTYLHPLAGRPLLYHSLQALADRTPAPERIILVGDADVQTDWLHEIAVPVTIMAPDEIERDALDVASDHPMVVVDATVPLAGLAVDTLAGAESTGLVCLGGAGRPVGARLDADTLVRFLSRPDPFDGLTAADGLREVRCEAAFAVRSRADLARASVAIRDRMVETLMRQGVTFLLPETVLIDLDVSIGQDTIVYPHVVLEGSTSVGRETVVGPGCRIIESWIGSGVELKGWNYISHTTVRNRAILEPYVRRGYD